MPDATAVEIALEAAECSNHCRHCDATYGPRLRHLSRDEIRSWADRTRDEAARLGVNIEVGLNNSETLDHPEWREVLADLGHEGLWRGFATNGRQIAREPGLVGELKERGVEWLQLTLGGASPKTHDAFACRRGALNDLIATARHAHAAGVHVAWVYIAYRPLAEIGRMSELAMSISGPCAAGRFDHKGGIDQCIFLVRPQGGGRKAEHLRPAQADLADLPAWAGVERFSRSYGAGCETEGDLVNALCNTERRVGCLETGCGGGCSLVACRNGDVYPRCHERHPAYLLGNLEREGLAGILGRFAEDPPHALAIRRRGLVELAARYGHPAGDKLHSGCSLCRTLVTRALEGEEQFAPAAEQGADTRYVRGYQEHPETDEEVAEGHAAAARLAEEPWDGPTPAEGRSRRSPAGS